MGFAMNSFSFELSPVYCSLLFITSPSSANSWTVDEQWKSFQSRLGDVELLR